MLKIFAKVDYFVYAAPSTELSISWISHHLKETLKNHSINEFYEGQQFFLHNSQYNSIKYLCSLYPDYTKENIDKTFAEFNFDGKNCSSGLLNQDLLKTCSGAEKTTRITLKQMH